MTPSRYAALAHRLDAIQKIYDQVEVEGEEAFVHIGGKLYAMAKPGFKGISLRHAFKRDGKLQASRFGGIFLADGEWFMLKLYAMPLKKEHPALKDAVPCDTTHDNEQGLISCEECNPFEDNRDIQEVKYSAPLQFAIPTAKAVKNRAKTRIVA